MPLGNLNCLLKPSFLFTAKKPLVAGSIGPYGASLHDGSEYTGDYIDKVKKETLKNWHRTRMNALIEEGVDLLAIETIPALNEGVALIELLQEYPNQKAWLSFQCKVRFKNSGEAQDFKFNR